MRPASFRDYERAVILSSLSGTVVARDEFLPVWADVEAAMELDLLGVAVRAASKERSSTIKRFQPRAQGRAFPIHKPMTHITIVVADQEA